MDSGASSARERIYRIANAALVLAPVPWLGAVATVIKEIWDLVEEVRVLPSQCRELADEVTRIATALDDHNEKHPGNSKLEDTKSALLRIVTDIKTDLARWKNLTRWYMRLLLHDEVLEKIGSYRIKLDAAARDLMISGLLSQDVYWARRDIDWAKRDEDIEIIKRDLEKLLQKQAQEIARAKEAYQRAKMIDVDKVALAKATERIFVLRLDPEFFPSEDMEEEVTGDSSQGSILGETSDVFKFVWLGRKWVAAKRLRTASLDEKQERRLVRQINIWRTLKHPHIVPILGICKFEADRPPYLISPWMKYGSVMDYLRHFPGQVDRVRLIHEVALGTQYLHSIGILHGNLKGSNVLVNIDHRVRLGGFGLSKELDREITFTRSNGGYELVRWWSPEVLNGDTLSEQSDIWSWGMTALEILSGVCPFKGVKNGLGVILHMNEVLPKPEDYENEIATNQLWNLMKSCWKPYGSRPEIGQIVKFLHDERVQKGWNPDAPPPEPKVDRDSPEAF